MSAPKREARRLHIATQHLFRCRRIECNGQDLYQEQLGRWSLPQVRIELLPWFYFHLGHAREKCEKTRISFGSRSWSTSCERGGNWTINVRGTPAGSFPRGKPLRNHMRSGPVVYQCGGFQYYKTTNCLTEARAVQHLHAPGHTPLRHNYVRRDWQLVQTQTVLATDKSDGQS